MKILIKLTVLFLSLISVAGCGNANTSTSSGASSSSYPLPSLDDSGPAIQSGTKVSAETIQDKTFEEKTDNRLSVYFLSWCPGPESNRYGIATAGF